MLDDGDPLQVGHWAREHVGQGFQHPPQDMRRADGDRRHRHVEVTAQQPGALALPVVNPVDAEKDRGAACALPAQQVDDGPVRRRSRAAFAAAAVDGESAGVSGAVGELGGSDVLTNGDQRVLDRNQALVDDRVNLGQDRLDPFAGIDRLGDPRQVNGNVGEPLRVDAPTDPELLNAAVQRRDFQPVKCKAVHQRLVGHAPAAVQRLAEVDVELQPGADHVIVCPR
jgi:hypothetical protein